ncbi:MAG: LamG-like jellyroll fold domain-containing protein, partial [Pirellulaceae bacterium]
GRAIPGTLLRENPEGGIPKGIEGETVEELAKAMQDFPIRYGQLGWRAEQNPIVGKPSPKPIRDLSEVDFRPSDESPAIDRGATYFIPWSLHGCVGEWHFTENRADPDRVTDYAWYQSRAHYYRMNYEHVPPLDLQLSDRTLEAYVESPLEDWCRGGVVFDGTRFAVVHDRDMRADITIPIYSLNKRGEQVKMRHFPDTPWIVPEPVSGEGRQAEYAPDAVVRYPGQLRNTLIIGTQNLMVEALFKSEPGLTNAALLSKHDGSSGYCLVIDGQGRAALQIGAGGKAASVRTSDAVNDGRWHHVLAEIDRHTGRMTVYLDGGRSGGSKTELPADVSLDCRADFLVGKGPGDRGNFQGVLDFMRICQGTLADAQTTIDELYQWETDGPFKYDFIGNAPNGRRDAGAIELIKSE